jgi:isopenicillin N synthase-like dioxygenase
MVTSTKENHSDHIPLIDLASPIAVVTEQLGFACREFGFFYLKHHGISDDLIQRLFQLVKRSPQ